MKDFNINPDTLNLIKEEVGDWASNLGQSRPEAANSTTAELSQLPGLEQAWDGEQTKTRDIYRSSIEPVTWARTDLRQQTPQEQVPTAEQVG